MQRTPRTPTTSAIWLVLGSIMSVQVGAAVAKTVMDEATPISMAWLRLVSAAVVLWLWTLIAARRGSSTHQPNGRPPRNWKAGLAYGVCLVAMNTTFYEGASRVPLGLAVTIEFLGPLAVAVAATRRARDIAWPLLALAGVALLGFTPTHVDPVGVAFVLAAAVCWAGYIKMGARAGLTWTGHEAVMLACTIGGVALAVPAIHSSGDVLLRPHVLIAGAGVGVLSSVIPYLLEMSALRTLPGRVFGILMSLEPAAAALAALVIIGEGLSPTDLVAMACVIAASIGATRSAG